MSKQVRALENRLMAQKEELVAWRTRVEALEDVLLAIVNRATDAGKDSTGQNIAIVRLALLNKAELELGFRVCETCGKRDRTVKLGVAHSVACDACADIAGRFIEEGR